MINASSIKGQDWKVVNALYSSCWQNITNNNSLFRCQNHQNRQQTILSSSWCLDFIQVHYPAAETETRLSFFRILNLYCKVQFLGVQFKWLLGLDFCCTKQNGFALVNNFKLTRKIVKILWLKKSRKWNGFALVDNFNLTRKIVKILWLKKIVKMKRFCCNDNLNLTRKIDKFLRIE